MARWIFSTTVEVDVRPFQSQQFAAPKSGGEVEVVELVHAAVSGLWKKAPSWSAVSVFYLFVFDFWQGTALCRIAGYQLLLDGELYAEPII